jgi:hypothetical protein
VSSRTVRGHPRSSVPLHTVRGLGHNRPMRDPAALAAIRDFVAAGLAT